MHVVPALLPMEAFAVPHNALALLMLGGPVARHCVMSELLTLGMIWSSSPAHA